MAASGHIASEETLDSDPFDEHTYITAYLHGWDSVPQISRAPSAWERLKAIDEILVPFKDFASWLTVIVMLRLWKVNTLHLHT